MARTCQGEVALYIRDSVRDWTPFVPPRATARLRTRTRGTRPALGRAPHAVLYVSPDQHVPARADRPRRPHALALPSTSC